MAKLRNRIVSDPLVMMGKPVIKGTRIPVEHILRRLGAGDSEQVILADHPRLTPEDIRAARANNGKKGRCPPKPYAVNLESF